MKSLRIIALVSLASFGLAFAAETKETPAKIAACCARATADGKTCVHECCVTAAKAGLNCTTCGGAGKAAPVAAKK